MTDTPTPEPVELTIVRFDEHIIPGKRLGGHSVHDPRSRNFQAARCEQRVSVIHSRAVGPFDQGNVGSCTGNAITGVLVTDPFTQTGRVYDEGVALEIYALATRLQSEDGKGYPEIDPGSSGLEVCQAALDAGMIGSYTHAFGLDHALDALVLAPVIIGIPWFDSFDQTDSDAKIHKSPDAILRGFHEIELLAVNVEDRFVTGMQSWGPGYGHEGLFSIEWDLLGDLLEQDGDCTVPQPVAA